MSKTVVLPETKMLRAKELADKLLALDGNPVVAVYDGIGFLTPVKLVEMEHDDMRLFPRDNTIIVTTDRDALAAELERIGRNKK